MSEASADTAAISDRIYSRIRTDVILGRLAPGQRLTLDRMRNAYGTSIGTLREVLNRLASEGFVAAEGARGFEVAPASVENLRELADMRLLLERHALRESFEAGDIEWEGRVVAAHHKLATIEKRMLAGDASESEGWKRYDAAFHNALISACGSKLLLETHAAVYDKYLRYLVLANVFRGRVAMNEHRKLVECALARDWKSAQRTLDAHVRECVACIMAKGLALSRKQ
ncbi:MAG TPA: GntR family transcriptional regulator [Casimicrobiaceae bacterium]|jgi:DNA-binding GntR family transcriptional regulator|nr:GntR family transcriptional regulator [Casimicrobiaceae bacterium]